MTISILGLILAQGIWLYNDYVYYRTQPLSSSGYNVFSLLLGTDTEEPIIDYSSEAEEVINTMDLVETDKYSQVSPISSLARLDRTIQFKSPALYVLQKMKWQFGASILLILITSYCFIYMLATIFSQRKLSLIKNETISNISHELNTPLSTVSVAIEAFISYDVEGEQKTSLYLKVCKKELDHLPNYRADHGTLHLDNHKMQLVKNTPA